MQTWSSKKKDVIEEVLTPEYMSSEESDWTDDEAGPVVKGYLTKKLPWERTKLTGIKAALDSTYFKALPQRARSTLLRRYPDSKGSCRVRPVGCEAHAWAVRALAPQPQLSSTPNTSRSISASVLQVTPIF
jgi:hypothetical protein